MATPGPLPARRKDLILERVSAEGEARAVDLADALGVSTITVRRDIVDLDAQGLLRRVRGGAQSADRTSKHIVLEQAHHDVGVIVPSFRYYWPAVLRGATREAESRGLRLQMHAASLSPADLHRAIDEISADNLPDALLVAPDLESGEESRAVLERLADLQCPVVLVERDMTPFAPAVPPMDSVRTDHAQGALAALAHLHGLGHSRLGLLHDTESPSAPRMLEAWDLATAVFELDEDSSALAAVETHGADPIGGINDFLDRCLARDVRAIHVLSDELALLTIRQAQRRGIRVPDDLSITAHDDELAMLARPALTAVSPAKEVLGRRAVDMIVHRLDEPDSPVEKVALIPELRVRESSAPPAQGRA